MSLLLRFCLFFLFLERGFGTSAYVCRGLLWGSRAPKSSVSTTTACKLWKCRSLLPCKAISLQKTGRMPTRLTFSSLLTFPTEACPLQLHCLSISASQLGQCCSCSSCKPAKHSLIHHISYSHLAWLQISFVTHSNACFPVLSRPCWTVQPACPELASQSTCQQTLLKMQACCDSLASSMVQARCLLSVQPVTQRHCPCQAAQSGQLYNLSQARDSKPLIMIIITIIVIIMIMITLSRSC